jgi:hypothetical protein
MAVLQPLAAKKMLNGMSDAGTNQERKPVKATNSHRHTAAITDKQSFSITPHAAGATSSMYEAAFESRRFRSRATRDIANQPVKNLYC